MLKIVLMCAILEGPFAGMSPCTPHKDMAACRAAEAGLATEVVQKSRCDIFESIIENELGSVAPIKAPIPLVRP